MLTPILQLQETILPRVPSSPRLKFKAHFPQACYTSFFIIPLQDDEAELIEAALCFIKYEKDFINQFEKLNVRMVGLETNQNKLLDRIGVDRAELEIFQLILEFCRAAYSGLFLIQPFEHSTFQID